MSVLRMSRRVLTILSVGLLMLNIVQRPTPVLAAQDPSCAYRPLESGITFTYTNTILSQVHLAGRMCAVML